MEEVEEQEVKLEGKQSKGDVSILSFRRVLYVVCFLLGTTRH